jgi:hypothetical protein
MCHRHPCMWRRSRASMLDRTIILVGAMADGAMADGGMVDGGAIVGNIGPLPKPAEYVRRGAPEQSVFPFTLSRGQTEMIVESGK